jgi:heme A synthase
VASTRTPSTPPAAAARTRSPLFSAVIGLAGLAILLQGVWAGQFIREGSDFRQGWVNVHSIGGTVIDVLGLIAMIIAIVQLRARRDILVGSIVFFVLVVLEGFIGALIGDHPALEALHIPVALFLMGMVAVLSFRASRPAA